MAIGLDHGIRQEPERISVLARLLTHYILRGGQISVVFPLSHHSPLLFPSLNIFFFAL